MVTNKMRGSKAASIVAKKGVKKRGRSTALEDVGNQQEEKPIATRKRPRSKRLAAAAAASNVTEPAFEAFVDPELKEPAHDGITLKKENSMVSISNKLEINGVVYKMGEYKLGVPAWPKCQQGYHQSSSIETAPESNSEADTTPYQPPAAHNSELASWYAEDILKTFRNSEELFRAPDDYLDIMDRDINAQMRGILIDWIVEVGEMYNLQAQTIYLCTNYLDRYVASHVVPRSSLQLVGVTCLQIASKYGEVSCPSGEQFSYISVTPLEEIMKMERKILDALNYRLCVVSGLDFCDHFCRACGATGVTAMLARYFLELTLQDYSFLSYSASVAAATSVKLALWHHDRISWDHHKAEQCEHDTKALNRCSEAMQQILLNVHESSLPAVKEKYSHSKFLRVSSLSFQQLSLEEHETDQLTTSEVTSEDTVTGF